MTEIDAKAIGTRIKEQRKKLQLTQTIIKNQIGISSGNLSDIENGNRIPATQTLAKLAIILQCSTDYIIYGTEKNSYIGDDEEAKTLLNMFRELPTKDKEELLMLAKMKYNNREKKGKSFHSPKNNSNTA